MQRSEIWNVLLGHVLRTAPWAEKRLEEIRRRTWYRPDLETAQLNLLIVCLELDFDDYRHRSKAKHLLRQILSPDTEEMREQNGVSLLDNLHEKHRIRLHDSLHWATDAPFDDFESMPVDDAVKLVRENAPILKGFRAYRWLNSLGYHVATPDLPRQRFLFRIGWLKEVSTNERGRRRAFGEIQQIAHSIEAPLREVDFVLGIFTGAIDDAGAQVAKCTSTPLCEECPLSSSCLYFRMRPGQREKSSLAESMREEDLPRERLRREGAERLTPAELLSILLRPGQSVPNTLNLAHRLLRHAGSLRRLSEMSPAGLAELPGVGAANAAILKAALELCRQFGEEEHFGVGQKFTSAEAVYKHFRARFLGQKQEELLLINLDPHLRVVRIVPLTKGLLHQTPAEAREVFKEAIKDSAHSIILVHNHPSGNPKPSRSDHQSTRQLYASGRLLNIPLLDHIIIGEEDYYSFAEEGTLEEPEDFP